jgi:hypothetical protein
MKGCGNAAQQRQPEREPHRLVQLRARVLVAFGAEELADDRTDGEHHAHQADEHRDVRRGPDGERREIGGRVARDEHGVDGGEQHHRDLAHEHRPGLRDDAARVGAPSAALRARCRGRGRGRHAP